MRNLGYLLICLGVAFGIIGLLFRSPSWVEVNGLTIPIWILWEILAAILVIGGALRAAFKDRI
jgi:hypothetical protein